MSGAKAIHLAPIAGSVAHDFVRRHHYSGKSVNNSQLHLGIFLGRALVGAMQFGPSLDKSKMVGLVRGTPWNGFLELNRLALVDDTPRNTESRALAVAMRLIRKHYPHVQWVVSFADGTQCGDGTIYRAAGFVLTAIKRNTQIWEAPTGPRESRTSLTDGRSKQQQMAATRLSRVTATKAGNILATGAASMRTFKDAGFKPLPGYQLRYLYFLDPTAHERLTVPVLPFSIIDRMGARMYRGQTGAGSLASEAPATHAGEGGATPTPALYSGTVG